MAYRNGNYSAFYVSSPFSESSLGAHATKDFCYYNMLRAWKGKDSSFPFNDSHDKTYNVRDGSDWEKTLKPRLRERLNNSKNIVLFLSERTKNSQALREEIDYGINNQDLPVIVVYTDFTNKEDILTASKNSLNSTVKTLWDNLPIFKSSKVKIPVLHVPMNQSCIKDALNNSDFMVKTKKEANDYFYK